MLHFIASARRRFVWTVVPWTLCWLCTGCAHFVETRTINLFAQALEADDLNQLKSRTSADFERKALRLSDATDVFKILRLPEGKTTVLSVEAVSETEKDVIVEVGQSKKKLKYRLKLDPDSEKWVIDDIFMRQKKQGLTVAKSVSEQMNLLLTVQEFLAAWDHGDREDVLAIATPEFAEILSQLPPDYLARLTNQVVSGTQQGSFNPKAEMDEKAAFVRFAARTGELTVSFHLHEDQWRVSDVSVDPHDRSNRIRSVRQRVSVISRALAFLDAFHAQDKQKLSESCTPAFFTGSVAPADLTLVDLPGKNLPPESYKVTIRGNHADFIVDQPSERMTISLVQNDESSKPTATTYQVDEVTIYELDGTQTKRLSALFTAHAVFRIFSEALVSRDLNGLRLSSTHDFNRRVWQKLDDQSIRDLPIREIAELPSKVLTTIFDGAVTEITVIQGTRALTYVLLDQDGQLLMDDVMLPVRDRPSSLKTTLELMIPIRQFANGITHQAIEQLQKCCSQDFNRLIWYQVRSVPDTGWPIPDHLNGILTAIDLEGEQTQVTLGDNRWGARIDLVKEHGQYVVDDAQLIAGPLPDQRLELKRALRIQFADHVQSGRYAPQSNKNR